jgi:hypothetical protein
VDALLTFFWLFGGALGALGVGATYFVRASRSSSAVQRIIASAYAPATVLVFIVGILAPREAWLALGKSSFLMAQVLPLALLGYSLARYPGNWRLHLVLVPLALLCWLWQFTWGHVLIFGK